LATIIAERQEYLASSVIVPPWTFVGRCRL
jgi:hypothetical protein